LKNKNKYIHRSKISEAKLREIIKYFSLDIEANKAAVLASLNRNTINRHYMLIRKRISEFCEEEGRRLGMAFAKYGCGAAGSASMVFGICLNKDKIYTEFMHLDVLTNDHNALTSKQELDNFSNSCTNSRWKDYRAVVYYNCGRYIRNNSNIESSNLTTDPKACDLFWGYTKSRLMKFKGISKSTLYYHIKECEFRFNHRNENLYKLLLKIMRQNRLD
jgi:transposase-like protein